MRQRLLALATALVCAALPGESTAYTRSTISSTDPAPIAWDLQNAETVLPAVGGGMVSYRLHPAGSDNITDGSDLEAVERAFRNWSGVSGATITFDRGPDTAGMTTLDDGEFPVFWSETTTLLDQGTADPTDDVSIAGALAVTFVFHRTDGLEKGEIIDANIVFNGADYSWTTRPEIETSRFDVESVAIHEIGHALGLDHSAVPAATMFPRVATGTSGPRSLSGDDVAAVTDAYPGGNSAANRGSLTGVLADSGGTPVFGGLVWVRDGKGRLAAQGVTDADGVYRLAGLPAGRYTLLAQPTNDPSGFYLFSEANMGPYFQGLNRSFLAASVHPVTVRRGALQVRHLTVPASTPSMDLKLIGRSGKFSNVATFLRRGETGILIAVAGPGLPGGGTPLSISGPGLSVTQTVFGSIAGFPWVAVRVNVATDAPLGPRDLVVESGGTWTAAPGGVEVRLPASTGLPLPVPATGGADPPVQLELVAGSIDLTWSAAAGAEWYLLYQGPLAALRAGSYDHQATDGSCHISVTDASILGPAAAAGNTYFLVASMNRAGESGLGEGAGETPRPAGLTFCP